MSMGASTASRRAAPPSTRFQRDRPEVGGVTHIPSICCLRYLISGNSDRRNNRSIRYLAVAKRNKRKRKANKYLSANVNINNEHVKKNLIVESAVRFRNSVIHVHLKVNFGRIRNTHMTDLSEAIMSKPADHLRTLHEKDQEKRLIVVLENASLETVKVRILYPSTAFSLIYVVSMKTFTTCHHR